MDSMISRIITVIEGISISLASVDDRFPVQQEIVNEHHAVCVVFDFDLSENGNTRRPDVWVVTPSLFVRIIIMRGTLFIPDRFSEKDHLFITVDIASSGLTVSYGSFFFFRHSVDWNELPRRIVGRSDISMHTKHYYCNNEIKGIDHRPNSGFPTNPRKSNHA